MRQDRNGPNPCGCSTYRVEVGGNGDDGPPNLCTAAHEPLRISDKSPVNRMSAAAAAAAAAAAVFVVALPHHQATNYLQSSTPATGTPGVIL